jgi:hypothetical protein
MSDTPIPTHCRFCVCGPLDYTNFICGTDYRLTRRGDLCREREARQKLEAEVEEIKANYIRQQFEMQLEIEELNRLLVGWKQRATMSETTLEATQKDLRRAVEIADAFYEHDGTPWNALRKELDDIKATLNP